MDPFLYIDNPEDLLEVTGGTETTLEDLKEEGKREWIYTYNRSRRDGRTTYSRISNDLAEEPEFMKEEV